MVASLQDINYISFNKVIISDPYTMDVMVGIDIYILGMCLPSLLSGPQPASSTI